MVRFQAGFTLVELLFVMVIVSLLAGIALPVYRDYVIRGKLPEATGELAMRRVQMEQFFLDNRTYVGSTTICPAKGTPDTSKSRYFQFYCDPAPTATTFTLVAEGVDDMVGFKFSINQLGEKKTVSVPTGWTPPVPNNCWITRKGGTC